MNNEKDAVLAGMHLQNSTCRQLTKVARTAYLRLEADLQHLNMSKTDWNALTGIGIDNIESPSELAEYLGISRPAMSRELKQLEDQDFIERRLTDDDGRSRTLSLTALGQNKIDEAWPVVKRHLMGVSNNLNEEQLTQLCELLNLFLTAQPVEEHEEA